VPNPAFKADVRARAFGWGQAYIDQQSTQRQSPARRAWRLGEEVASIW
jgi:hypothetical protein